MNPVATRPMPTPAFLGNAGSMESAEWLEVNAIHLRERWRYLLDSCVALGMEPPDENDYAGFCASHYDTERSRRLYREAAP